MKVLAWHPAVGVYVGCHHCDWHYGFAPAWQAWLASWWHWVRC